MASQTVLIAAEVMLANEEPAAKEKAIEDIFEIAPESPAVSLPIVDACTSVREGLMQAQAGTSACYRQSGDTCCSYFLSFIHVSPSCPIKSLCLFRPQKLLCKRLPISLKWACLLQLSTRASCRPESPCLPCAKMGANIHGQALARPHMSRFTRSVLRLQSSQTLLSLANNWSWKCLTPCRYRLYYLCLLNAWLLSAESLQKYFCFLANSVCWAENA